MQSASPFLIIGAGRGGTSLLASCLGGHSRTHVAMELFGADVLMGHGMPPGNRRSLLETRIRRFRDCCEEERARFPGVIWGNKITTEHLYGLEDHNALNPPYRDVIRPFRETMGDYRVAFILRDGRSCIASKTRRTGQPLAQAAFRWRYSVAVLRSLQASGMPFTLVKFEELVLRPRETLEGVCAGLDLDFEEAMLGQTASKALIPEYRQDGFIADKAGIPDLPEDILCFIRSDLEYCGYPVGA